MNSDQLNELMDDYRQRGAPGEQQTLIALLREVQQLEGGSLPNGTLERIAGGYGLKKPLLMALIRRIPSLRCESVPHRMEVCGTCPKGAALRAFIEKTYGVKSGSENEAAGFSYWVTGCMKNCKKGPSLKWDGTLYPCADEALVRKLIGK